MRRENNKTPVDTAVKELDLLPSDISEGTYRKKRGGLTMKGLEISELYYREVCQPMLERDFPALVGRIAVGVAGEGSECFGFDDEISRDHDFEPSLCLWLGQEDFEKYGFALSRAYAKLPSSFMGLERQKLAPVGGARRGVCEIGSFFEKFLGTRSVPETWEHWLSIPESSLACASNGKVFRDDLGELSGIRRKLREGYPRDIQLKKLAARLLFMSQSGQYNFSRCLAHGEREAAQMALFIFVKNALSAIYLLNNRYEPFYKWAFRALLGLERMSDAGTVLSSLISSENSAEPTEKLEIINRLCDELCRELYSLGLTEEYIPDLEAAAYFLNDGISDPSLRNLHIMAGAPRE